MRGKWAGRMIALVVGTAIWAAVPIVSSAGPAPARILHDDSPVAGIGAGGTTTPRSAVPAAPSTVCAPVPAVSDTCPAWTATYDNPDGDRSGQGYDQLRGVVPSPDGRQLFAYGLSNDDTNQSSDLVVIAYDAATGAQEWLYRYNSPGNEADLAFGAAVSSGSSTIYVDGIQAALTDHEQLLMIAVDTATGTARWVTTYADPDGGNVEVVGPIVSHDGQRLYAGGSVWIGGAPDHAIAFSIDAATGAIEWTTTYALQSRLVNMLEIAGGDGDTFYLSGYERPQATLSSTDDLTLAFGDDRAGNRGVLDWASTYDGNNGRIDKAYAIAVAPDGSKLAITGYSQDASTGHLLMTTVGYDASGNELWSSRYAPSDQADFNQGHAIAFSPDGTRVFVTGESDIGTTVGGKRTGPADELTTLGINAGSGSQLWAVQFVEGTLFDIGSAITVSGDGRTVYVAGDSGPGAVRDALTLAYDAGSGTTTWTSRVGTVGPDLDTASSIALSPDGRRLYVGANIEHLAVATATAQAAQPTNAVDFLTESYDLSA